MNNGPWFQPGHPDRRMRTQVWDGEKYVPAFSDAELNAIEKMVDDKMAFGFGAVAITERGEVGSVRLQ